MSRSLYWDIIPTEKEENDIDSLKKVLARKVWDAEGTIHQPKTIVNSNLIPFLEGIVAGNGSGDMGRDASKLIEAINQHGEVYIYID